MPVPLSFDKAAMGEASLLDAFVAGGGAAPGEPSALEALLRDCVREARQRWPELGVTDAEFIGYVGARVGAGKAPIPAHAADLLLACACSRGELQAIEAFDQLYGPVIDRVLMHRKAAPHLADDARQILRERLLVGDAAANVQPKITAYRGTGPLASWVATSAATTLLMLRRSANRRREQAEDSRVAPAGAPLDPELEYLRQRYKVQLEEAIIHALGGLGERDRTLLRLHLAQRMSIDALGEKYSVNRATAARWLAAARRALLSGARERLRARLRLSDSECDSLIGLVDGGLDVSIVRRLSEP
jgi:RNA polymerase sigma-70 factor, ECF subfamily